MKVEDLSDDDLLEKLLEEMDVGDKFKVFSNMLEQVQTGRPLSPKQRDWAEDEFKKHNLDDELPAENIISSGRYVPTAEERAKKYPFEMMPKPLRPPGR